MANENHIYTPPPGTKDAESFFSVEVKNPSRYGVSGTIFLRSLTVTEWPFILDPEDNHAYSAKAQNMLLRRGVKEGHPVLYFNIYTEGLAPATVMKRLKDAKVISSAPEGWRYMEPQAVASEPASGLPDVARREKWTSYANSSIKSRVAAVQFEPDNGAQREKPLAGVITFWSEAGKVGEGTRMKEELATAVQTFAPPRQGQEEPTWTFSRGTNKEIQIKDDGKVIGTKGQFTIHFKGASGSNLQHNDLLEFLSNAQVATAGHWEHSLKMAPPDSYILR